METKRPKGAKKPARLATNAKRPVTRKPARGAATGAAPTTRKAARAPARSPAAAAATSSAARELALVIAGAALEKKAMGVEILDVTGKVDYADYLVLMTGTSNRHVDSLAHAIQQAVEATKKRALSVEGLPAAVWVLIDFGDVVVHVFQDEARGMYDIEGLWLDANRLPVPGGAK